MAPVAGGVADRKEDRLALVPGTLESLRAPRIPVHRVVGVLEKVGAGLIGEAVRSLVSHATRVRVVSRPEPSSADRSDPGRGTGRRARRGASGRPFAPTHAPPHPP